jgi:RES domain-containing protein
LIPAWRVCRAVHADLSGAGAERHGGRWNSPGLPVVYLAGQSALAVLEVRVHLDLPPELIPADYVLLRVKLPADSVEECATLATDPRAAGDAWLRSGRSAVLRVPSVLVPDAWNLLLNPRHPRAAAAEVERSEPFRFDVRLWGRGG